MEDSSEGEKRKRDPNETILTEEKQRQKTAFRQAVFARSSKVTRSPPTDNREAMEQAKRSRE